jgi:hypothetical protein
MDKTTCPVCEADRYKRGTKKAPRKAQIQAADSAGSSSQMSTGKVPWDNPYVRGINIAKEQLPLKRPHLGRVTGAGVGRKHSAYGLAEPSTKESR